MPGGIRAPMTGVKKQINITSPSMPAAATRISKPAPMQIVDTLPGLNAPAPVRAAAPRSSAPAPRSPARPAPMPSVGAQYSGGGLAASRTGAIAETIPQGPPEPPPQPLGFDQFRGDPSLAMRDAAYMSEEGSAEAEFKNLVDQLTRQNAEFKTGVNQNFKNLGLKWQGEDYGTGTWDPTDMQGAYGQAFTNQTNDFAGRGLMDSSFYGQAQEQLTGRFNRQRDDVMTALTNQNNEFNAGKNNAQTARNAAKERALAEAYARYTAGFGA